jgi:hypothetical protein
MKHDDAATSTVSQVFADNRRIEAAIRAGAREAMLLHKRMGLPAVGCHDGKIVWIPPEEFDRYMKDAEKGIDPTG